MDATALLPAPTSTDGAFSEDAKTRGRLGAHRRARWEAKGGPQPIYWPDDDTLCTVLPAELPIDVLEPLTSIDLDLALFFRQAMSLAIASQRGDAAGNLEAWGVVTDILVHSPNLPASVKAAAAEAAQRLLNQPGYPDAYSQFCAGRPSPQDWVELFKLAVDRFGSGLGELLPPPSASPESSGNGGTTSNTTSNAGTDSTPEVSGPSPDSPDSSGSAG